MEQLLFCTSRHVSVFEPRHLGKKGPGRRAGKVTHPTLDEDSHGMFVSMNVMNVENEEIRERCKMWKMHKHATLLYFIEMSYYPKSIQRA